MAQTNLTFATNSLQTANIVTAEIDHLNLPAQYQPVYPLAHADGSSIPYQGYVSRVIRISGTLIGTSIANLDALIDTFKGYFNGVDQNLDIDYNGTTRRYIATVNAITITRPGNLAYASFQVDFVCSNPFGINTANTTALSQSARTNSTYTDAYTFLGTAPYQLPVATITLTSVATSVTNLIANPGFETDTSGWSSGGIGTFTRVTTQHQSGIAAGQMVNAASSPLSVPVANTYGWELYNISGLTVGVTYTVSVWLKGNAGSESVQVKTLGANAVTTSLTTSWQKVTFTFVATATTDQFYVYSTTASATWFIDDLSVVSNDSAYIIWGNNGNGQTIGVTRAFVSGDVVVIDCVAKTVTVNGVLVPYVGAFPEFPPGAQNFTYQDSFSSRTFTISVVYAQRFL
jgi:hypothetical protein